MTIYIEFDPVFSIPVQDSSLVVHLSDLISTSSTLLYYPVEHIAWASEHELLPFQSSTFWALAIYIWALSLLASCVRSILTLCNVRKEIARKSPARSRSSLASTTSSKSKHSQRHTSFQDKLTGAGASLKDLRHRYFEELLSLVQNICNIMNAVNWMPRGILWAQKLPKVWVGVFGALSSLVGLYKILCLQQRQHAQ